MPDMRNSPAFDTLNAAPVWTSRYLRSTASMTTGGEGNREERGFFLEFMARLKKWWQGILKWWREGKVQSEKEPLPGRVMKKSDIKALKKTIASAKSKFHDSVREQENMVLSRYNFLTLTTFLHGQSEVPEEIRPFLTTLVDGQLQLWADKKISVSDFAKIFVLPTGPTILDSPYVWIWLDYLYRFAKVSGEWEHRGWIIAMFRSNEAFFKMLQYSDKHFDASHPLVQLHNSWVEGFESVKQLQTEFSRSGVKDPEVLKSYEQDVQACINSLDANKAPEPKQV